MFHWYLLVGNFVICFWINLVFEIAFDTCFWIWSACFGSIVSTVSCTRDVPLQIWVKYLQIHIIFCTSPIVTSCLKHSFDDEKQSFEDGKQSFMTFWHVFVSDWNIFGQEIFSLDKFWFCRLTQNAFKPLVWPLLHQNLLNISCFMNVYEILIIFIKSLIFNRFWWKKCQTRGLRVFWVDLQIWICLKSIFLAQKYLSQTCKIKENITGSMRILLPHHKTPSLSLMF